MEKQNVIYIHTHDSGCIFSPYGYDVPTDGLKKFAEDATLFTNAFCASSTCSPSRSALVTGRYPHNNGMMGLANRGFCLSDYGEHMANVFAGNGYTTVLCGIQHEYGRYSNHREGAERIGYQYDISSDCSGLSEKEMVEWDSSNLCSFTKWLDSYQSEAPFFLSFGLFSTHREYPDPSCEILENTCELPEFLPDICEVREDFKGHLESLRHFDRNFSGIIASLKEKGIYDNTVIIFTTDHGIAFPRAKCTLYDAGLRVALVIRVPGKALGKTADGLISHVDLLPTLCSLLRLKHTKNFDGIDVSKVFEQPELPLRREIFAEVNFHTSYEPIRCIRTEDYKYIRYYDREYLKSNLSNIDNSPSKEVYMDQKSPDERKEEEQFYDLTSDNQELINLMDDERYQQRIHVLKRRLEQLQEELGDPILNGPIPISQSWVVNTSTCVNPRSREDKDFI